MSLSRNIFYNILTQIPTAILGFVSGIFITRILGPHGRGVFSIFLADTELFSLFLSFGLSSAMVYFISSKKIAVAKLAGIAVMVLIVCSMLTAIIILCFSLFFDDAFIFPEHFNSVFYSLYLIAVFPLSLLNGFISCFFQGLTKFYEVRFVSIFNSVLNVIFFGVLFFLMRFSFVTLEVRHVLLISLIVLFINSLCWIVFYFRRMCIIPSFHFSIKEHIKPLFVFAGISYLSDIINFMNYRLDIWIVQHFRDSEQVGFYSLAASLAQMFWLFSTPIATVLVPYLSGGAGDALKNLRLFSRFNCTFVLLLMVISIPLAGFFIPLIYGMSFSSSVIPFLLLLPGMFFSCLTKIFAACIFSRNKPQYNMIATAVGLIFTIALDLILIPRYGIVGASIATSVAYISIFVCVNYFLFFRIKLAFKNYFFLTKQDICEVSDRMKIFLSNAKL